MNNVTKYIASNASNTLKISEQSRLHNCTPTKSEVNALHDNDVTASIYSAK